MRINSFRQGATIYGSNNSAFVLGEPIGKGGEGTVWSVHGDQTVVAKFYHDGLSAEKARKLEAMCRMKSDKLLRVAAWPIATVTSRPSGKPEGLLMPRIAGFQEAHLLYSPKSRRTAFPEAQFPFILHVTANIARSFAVVHDAGQVIGDVNHGNLLVSNKATVGLIDCDSFQITENGILFPCLVGVPTYTPPELQGRNFQDVRRTQEHDAFGLAVLIFHMLCLGRHPFSGIYKHGTADMTIEQAISDYRFPYLDNYSQTLMQPPPSAPRLVELSPELAKLFVGAFTRQAMTGRPSAHEWILALENLTKQLKPCSVNRSHHFFNHLTDCPWCRVEGMVGIPMFGIVLLAARDEQFNLNAVWAQIDAIQISNEEASSPTSKHFYNSCTVNAKIAEAVRRRRTKRLLSVTAITVAMLVVSFGQLPFAPAIVILGIGLYGMRILWHSGNLYTAEFHRAYETGVKQYRHQANAWATIKDTAPGFREAKTKLQEARSELLELPTLRARKLAELNANRAKKQHQRYLERHRVDDATIAGIGPGRKALLRAYNIEDAYDVELARLEQIKGFGPTLRTALLGWRLSVERTFVFDPHQSIDPADSRAIEQELNQRRANAILQLNNGVPQLQRCLLTWQAQRACTLNALREAARYLAQAEVDKKALRTF